MSTVYYVEINILCIVILLLFKGLLRRKSENSSTANNLFNMMLLTTVLYCVSDIFAGVFRGQTFPGARALIEISNTIYYECLTVISFLWMLYVFIKLGLIRNLNKGIIICSIPLLLFSITALSNHFTGFLFSIDENNFFVRGVGTYFHWVITWGYMIIPLLKTALVLVNEKNKNRKKEIAPLMYFIIAPVIAGIVQMLFYGVSTSQVGVTVSIVIISLIDNSNRVLSDSLTGLNNRHGFNEYITNHIQHHSNVALTIFMIDINSFKHINDRFGHIVGDHALLDTAVVLKKASGITHNRLFLCRYGGDEFVIAALDFTKEDISLLKAAINKEMESKNSEDGLPYELSVSIGTASGKCADYSEVEHLLRASDAEMYEEKKALKEAVGKSA